MPTGETSQRVQLLRAVVLASVASVTATVAHAAAGGHVASGPAVLVAVALLTGAALPLVRTRPGRARTAALLAGLQVSAHVVHGVSGLLAGSASGRVPGGHAHHGHGALDASVVGAATASLPLADLLPSPGMVLAHLVAAVVVGAVLARGEASWWSAAALADLLARRVGRVLARLLATVAVPVTHVPRRVTHVGRDAHRSPARSLRDVWRSGVPGHRGPPLLLGT
ncbi:hypothetical protein [Intrasporangium sp. YIM S08009]|uniref:hypothetical protein n=1 Tax=Intrasporangium zincisolvens TaxID=3080018 RepID=UPI002B055995|nr:hypothetical protein [Intrasporangium sp. YIM S08009]